MGIFDKFKRKNEQATKTEKMAETKSKDESVANNGNRFTFMAEDIFSLTGQGIVVVGFVVGKITTGDAYYMYHPSKTITVGMIEGIENGPGHLCTTAENQNVAIKMGNMNKEDIPVFTVLSSIRPQTQTDVNKAVENPDLLGLMTGYGRFSSNIDYLNILIYRIAHAKFLMAMYLDNEPIQNDDGTVTLNEGTTIGFPSLTSNDNTSAMPIFTDWNELGKWTTVFDEQHPPKTAINSFQDAVRICADNNDGVVINPFGKTPIFLSNSMITKIMNSDGYKREFG